MGSRYVGAGLLLLAALLGVAGCGGSQGGPAAVPSASTSPVTASMPPTTPSASDTATPTADPSATAAAALLSGEVVCDASNDGTITLSVPSADGLSLTQVTQIDVTTVLAGWTWTGQGFPVGCGDRLTWSADFSKVLFAGTPPGADAQVTHIAVLDVATSTITDLTQPRQGAGFSAGSLTETAPAFVGPAGTRVAYGSDEVVFQATMGVPSVLSLSDPSKAHPVKVTNPPPVLDRVVPGHPEGQIDQGYNPTTQNARPMASPTGTFIVWNDEESRHTLAWPAASPQRATPVTCGASGDRTDAIGWSDPTHVIVANGDQSTVYSAGLTADGRTATCVALIPPTARVVSKPELTLDGSALVFTASSPSGDQVYSVPTRVTKAAEPVAGTYPQLADTTNGYFTIFLPSYLP